MTSSWWTKQREEGNCLDMLDLCEAQAKKDVEAEKQYWLNEIIDIKNKLEKQHKVRTNKMLDELKDFISDRCSVNNQSLKPFVRDQIIKFIENLKTNGSDSVKTIIEDIRKNPKAMKDVDKLLKTNGDKK